MPEMSVLFGMALFFLFPMAIGVNDQQDKNNEGAYCENDNDRFVMPHFTYKIGNIRTHFSRIYTIFAEWEMDGKRGARHAFGVGLYASLPERPYETIFRSARISCSASIREPRMVSASGASRS